MSKITQTNTDLFEPSTTIPRAEKDAEKTCYNCSHYAVCEFRRDIASIINTNKELDTYTAEFNIFRGVANSCLEFKI